MKAQEDVSVVSIAKINSEELKRIILNNLIRQAKFQ